MLSVMFEAEIDAEVEDFFLRISDDADFLVTTSEKRMMIFSKDKPQILFQVPRSYLLLK